MLYCIYRNSKMCRNLFIRPSLTCKHGNGKFHRRKFIRYFLFRFIIMYHHPASAEKKDSICNLPVSIRIILPDTRLNQPAQKTMVFNKRLNEIIHFGKIPSLHKFRLRFLHILPVDPTHRHHTPDVDHTDRINVIRHKQCSLTHSISTPVLPVQIHLMRHHINRKQPQPLRKHPAIPLQRRNPLCRKMQKNNTSIPGQNTNRLNLLRSPFTFHQLHTLLNPLQTTPRRSRITKRKIRIAIKYTRRKPQLYRLILKIRLRNLTTFLRPARKIKSSALAIFLKSLSSNRSTTSTAVPGLKAEFKSGNTVYSLIPQSSPVIKSLHPCKLRIHILKSSSKPQIHPVFT